MSTLPCRYKAGYLLDVDTDHSRILVGSDRVNQETQHSVYITPRYTEDETRSRFGSLPLKDAETVIRCRVQCWEVLSCHFTGKCNALSNITGSLNEEERCFAFPLWSNESWIRVQASKGNYSHKLEWKHVVHGPGDTSHLQKQTIHPTSPRSAGRGLRDRYHKKLTERPRRVIKCATLRTYRCWTLRRVSCKFPTPSVAAHLTAPFRAQWTLLGRTESSDWKDVSLRKATIHLRAEYSSLHFTRTMETGTVVWNRRSYVAARVCSY